MESINGEPRSYLLRLPREVRDEIWRALLVSTKLWIRPVHGQKATRLHSNTEIKYTRPWYCGPKHSTLMDTSILAVSKQIHEESQDILIRENNILVDLTRLRQSAQILTANPYHGPLATATHITIYLNGHSRIVDLVKVLESRTNIKSLTISIRCPYHWRNHDFIETIGKTELRLLRSSLMQLAKINVLCEANIDTRWIDVVFEERLPEHLFKRMKWATGMRIKEIEDNMLKKKGAPKEIWKMPLDST